MEKAEIFIHIPTATEKILCFKSSLSTLDIQSHIKFQTVIMLNMTEGKMWSLNSVSFKISNREDDRRKSYHMPCCRLLGCKWRVENRRNTGWPSKARRSSCKNCCNWNCEWLNFIKIRASTRHGTYTNTMRTQTRQQNFQDTNTGTIFGKIQSVEDLIKMTS